VIPDTRIKHIAVHTEGRAIHYPLKFLVELAGRFQKWDSPEKNQRLYLPRIFS
jgi:hypothetical protein